MAKQKTTYEFKTELVDEYGDIFDYDHQDTFAEALRYCKTLHPLMEESGIDHADLCVVRDVWDLSDGKGNECLIDRAHCYLISNGVVPDKFVFDEDGSALPKKIGDQIRACS